MTTVTVVIQNSPYKENNKAWHALRFAGAALAGWVKESDHVMVFQGGTGAAGNTRSGS